MARILLVWELGMNLGHLARLLPVAARLKADGHVVQVRARNLQAAALILGPALIAYRALPVIAPVSANAPQLSGYADLLLATGWRDPSVLSGLVSRWHECFHSFRPDVVILDHAPTAGLAARLAGLPTLALGNGFEIPPATLPLPCFPGIPGIVQSQATLAEEKAVASVKQVAGRLAEALPPTFAEILRATTTCLATFPDLDHYGLRADCEYIGPLIGTISGQSVDWPLAAGPRIFACLRPDTRQLDAVLGGLLASDASIICFAPAIPAETLARFASTRVLFCQDLIDLAPLVATANACISYGAEGTMARFLLAGVPQLLVPGHVEAAMAAARLEAMGAAIVLRGMQNSTSVVTSLRFLIDRPEFRRHAQNFADRHRRWQPQNAVDRVMAKLMPLIAPNAKFETVAP